MKKRRVLSFASVAAMLLTMFLSVLVAGVSAAPVLPGGATIAEDAEKLVLHPGDVDWVIGSKAAYVHSTDGQTYYTDYAKPWAENSQGDFQGEKTTLYAFAPAIGSRQGDYYWGGFMGYPLYNVYRNNAPWCHGGFIYKVEGGAYVALALPMAKSLSKARAEEYVFETSTDGTTWTPLTATITLDFDAADPHNNVAPMAPVNSVYKAVMQMPGTSSDTIQLRVTMPGGKDNGNGYTYPGMGYDANMFIGTMVVSANDLSQYKKLDEVPEFKTPVLAPGIYDDLTDDYYYSYNIRSTWKDADNYNWNDAAGYAATFATQTNEAWEGWTELMGRFMGQVIPLAVKTNVAWNGSAIIYEVEAGSYIATAIPVNPDSVPKVGEGDAATVDFTHFGFDVSADKATWTAVTPEIVLDSACVREGNKSFFDVYKAVVQIPEGMKYYRITLPGFDMNATNGNEYKWTADRETKYDGNYWIGPSLASKYDLSDYTDLKDIPDSPVYVDIKAELKEAILLADAVVLSSYQNDDAKEAFVAKLAEAKEYLEADHTQAEYQAMATALNAAREALNKKDVPSDATIEQDDDRKILKPGVADWLSGSVFTKEDGTPVKKGDGRHEWYACYTDYALSSLIAQQDNLYLDSKELIHATNYDHYLYDTFQKFSFMGRPLEGGFVNTVSWAASNIKYRVYAGSYLSSAILVYGKAAGAENWPDIQKKYVFQVSADDKTWTNVDATITEEQTEGDWKLYKAVVKIPDGNYYCRIVMPGADSISESTTWYQGCPSYEQTFLGPTIASMSNLAEIDTYEDIPDATEWYADPAITSKDEEKIQITEQYFKTREDNMTIADALAAIDTATGTFEFYTADGAKITDETTKLVAGMKADIVDMKGNSMNKALGLPMLTVSTGNDLLSIAELDDIVLEYGAEKTAEGLKLPATVKIEAGNGSFDAQIEWDVDGCDYDPSVSQEQTFTVTGTVVLPENVTNGSNLSLEVGVNVTVQGSTDYGVRSTDESKAKVDSDEDVIYVKEGLTLEEINAILQPVGDVTIVFASADGEDLSDLSVKAERGMTIDVYTDVVMIKSYEIAFLGDAGGNDSNVSNDSDVSVPDTGDSSNNMLSVMLLAFAAAASGAAVILAKKRRA